MQVRVENLYFMLSYAWDHLDEGELVRTDASAARTPEELFARVLLCELRRLHRQRLDRGFREHAGELRRPRGKIQVARSAARGSASRGFLECAYDETSEDVLHNRILKASALRLSTVPTLEADSQHELRTFVRKTPEVANVPISAHDFQRVQLCSNLRRYRFALSVCELLHRCLLPEPGMGRWLFRSFTGNEQEMGAFFESFVRGFLHREQSTFRVGRTTLDWRSEGETNGLLPKLRTDITLRRPGHTVLVETKCYREALKPGRMGARSTLRSSDLCQLHAYLANFADDTAHLTGVLLYAVDSPIVPTSRMRVAGHDVLVLELNVAQPWVDVDRALREVVRELERPFCRPTVDCSQDGEHELH